MKATKQADMVGLLNIFSIASTANLWMRVGRVQHAAYSAPNYHYHQWLISGSYQCTGEGVQQYHIGADGLSGY